MSAVIPFVFAFAARVSKRRGRRSHELRRSSGGVFSPRAEAGSIRAEVLDPILRHIYPRKNRDFLICARGDAGAFWGFRKKLRSGRFHGG